MRNILLAIFIILFEFSFCTPCVINITSENFESMIKSKENNGILQNHIKKRRFKMDMDNKFLR